ncbi:MAG: zinc ribbon domain-containing protein, partial [Acholeplasmatales bacterium]|nr:zinc ribbon domain-containing protein [Acholeplasmatales bacterium]
EVIIVDNQINKEEKNFFSSEGKRRTNRITTLILYVVGILLIAASVIFIPLTTPEPVEARVSEIEYVSKNGVMKQLVEFKYVYNGTEYFGYEYYSASETNYKPYDTFELYVSKIQPSNYHLTKSNSYLVLLTFAGVIGVFLLAFGIGYRISFLRRIKAIGDLNNDGKIDEEDLVEFQKQEKEKERLEKERIERLNYCQYCGAKYPKDAIFCEQCGAPRTK